MDERQLPDWKFWLHMPQVQPWQACALALNIDPDSVMRTDDGMGALGSGTYTFRGFPSDEIGDNFIKLLRLLEANLGNKQYFTPTYHGTVCLPEFAAWCAHVGFAIPPELAALAAPQPAPKVEAGTSQSGNDSDDVDHDEKLAALFDPLPVEAVRGITKSAVINAFQELYFDRDKWNKYLGDPPDWLKECRVMPGVQGNKTSATWNPVLIAAALFDKGISIRKFDAVFVSLKDWADEWREVSASFRD